MMKTTKNNKKRSEFADFLRIYFFSTKKSPLLWAFSWSEYGDSNPILAIVFVLLFLRAWL